VQAPSLADLPAQEEKGRQGLLNSLTIRDRLGPLVPPSPVQPGISEKSGLPPARVQGAAGFLAPAAAASFPQARDRPGQLARPGTAGRGGDALRRVAE